MDKYAIRVVWQGHGYPKYLKRDPSRPDTVLERPNGILRLTRHIADAWTTEDESDAYGMMGSYEFGLPVAFNGIIEVIET